MAVGILLARFQEVYRQYTFDKKSTSKLRSKFIGVK